MQVLDNFCLWMVLMIMIRGLQCSITGTLLRLSVAITAYGSRQYTAVDTCTRSACGAGLFTASSRRAGKDYVPVVGRRR